MNMLASIKDTEIQVNVVLQYGGQREMDQWWTERNGSTCIAIPSPCRLCPHFLEVLA